MHGTECMLHLNNRDFKLPSVATLKEHNVLFILGNRWANDTELASTLHNRHPGRVRHNVSFSAC